jgi:hypothetical protein
MASLWSTLYPAHNGVTRFDDVISPEAHLPAEVLHEAGFRTVGIFRNGWVAANFGFDQGFDLYIRPTIAPRPAFAAAGQSRPCPTAAATRTRSAPRSSSCACAGATAGSSTCT